MAEQASGPGMFKNFLTDPRNLTTALVFLAGALNQRQPGQSTASNIANAGVGALGFRGGLERGMRNQRIQDDEIQARNLERSQDQENRQTQLGIQQQGVNLQGQQLNQNERLARERMTHEQKLATTVRPETPEEAALKRSMAGYYNRMPKDGSGGGKDFQSQMFEDLFREQWKQEVASAALEGRQPDVTKVIPQMANFATGLQYLPTGMQFERGADGVLYLKVPGNPDGSPPPSVLPSTPNAPTPGPELVTTIAGAPPGPQGPISFDQGAPQAPPAERPRARINPRGGPTQELVDSRALEGMNVPQLQQWLKDPRLSKEQAVRVRQTIQRKEAARRAESR